LNPACGALLAVLLVCCGGGTPSPRDAVTRYFERLARDPARLLQLTTPDFHRSHGIQMEQLEGWSFSRFEPRFYRVEPGARQSFAPAATDAIESLQLAWLMAQALETVQESARALDAQVVEERLAKGGAIVATRVHPGPSFGSRPFRQTFHLVRSGGDWKIDRIEQEAVSRREVLAAFSAYPSAATLRGVRAARRAR
jgi:hypothetical protein